MARYNCESSPYLFPLALLMAGLLLFVSGLVRAVDAVRLEFAGKQGIASVEDRSTPAGPKGGGRSWKVAYFELDGHGYSHEIPDEMAATEPDGAQVPIVYLPANPRVNRLGGVPATLTETYGQAALGLILFAAGVSWTAYVYKKLGPVDLSE